MSNFVIINYVSRIGIAFVFFYHGLVPKILMLSSGEIAMIEAHELAVSSNIVAIVGGVLEIVLAALLLVFYRHKWSIYIAAVALLVLLIDVTIFSPQFLWQAFNPVTLNVSVLCLCVVNLLSLGGRDLKNEK